MGSCVKKCKLANTSEDSGEIIEDVIIYPSVGYITGNMNGDYHIHGADNYADEYQISFDGGYVRGDVPYNLYSILANPIAVKCDVSLKRTVTRDDVNGIVTYHIDVTECKTTCDESRYIENYVLVPAIPASYTVVYTHTINEK
ncbi:MAG: hypothetical protein EP333_00825 [Bacteroidetes bacterium]|nr:MAG: hypothetical protein EP333_00825 [Bacteroidota bacterium]